jgi:hypothetical protein
MATFPLVGLIIFVVAPLVGMAVAAVRGLRAWRALRSFQRRLERAGADTMRLVDGIEPRVARSSAAAAKLDEARARLQESMATAAVLLAALDEARALFRRVAVFVPH